MRRFPQWLDQAAQVSAHLQLVIAAHEKYFFIRGSKADYARVIKTPSAWIVFFKAHSRELLMNRLLYTETAALTSAHCEWDLFVLFQCLCYALSTSAVGFIILCCTLHYRVTRHMFLHSTVSLLYSSWLSICKTVPEPVSANLQLTYYSASYKTYWSGLHFAIAV